jgi:hypothetical protein
MMGILMTLATLAMMTANVLLSDPGASMTVTDQQPPYVVHVMTVVFVGAPDGLFYPICREGCYHWMVDGSEPGWSVGQPSVWQAYNHYLTVVNRRTGSGWLPLPPPPPGA